jgi:hypothetical protein
MDKRLEKALEFGNYMVTLNNQKRLLKERFLDQSVHYVDGHKFEINRELINYCKTLIDLGHQQDVVIIDSLNAPYRVPDLNQFLEVILDIYMSNLNSYHTEYNKIKPQRSVQDIVDHD